MHDGTAIQETPIKIHGLSDVLARADEAELASAEAEIAASIQDHTDAMGQVLSERGQRRADALWAVWRAKAQDGRADQPPTAHDADTAWLIVDLLHQVAGRGDQVRVPSAAASSSVTTGRAVSPEIETAIAKSAVVVSEKTEAQS